MEDQPKENANEKPGDEKWRNRLAKALAEHIADQKQTWGDTDDLAVARYVSGDSTPEERVRVEKAMEQFPYVKKWVELARGDDVGPGQEDGNSWTGRTDQPTKGPDKGR